MKASASHSTDPKKVGIPASSPEVLRDESAPVSDATDNVLPENARPTPSPAESVAIPTKVEQWPSPRTRNSTSRPPFDISQIVPHLHARTAPDLSILQSEEHQARTLSDATPVPFLFRPPWDSDDGKEYDSLFTASLRKRTKGRKPLRRAKAHDVFPEFVPVFVRGMGECDYITRQKVCVWPGGTYLPLRQLSGLLGVSPVLLERVMRQILPGSLTDAANLLVYDEHDRHIRPGDTPKNFGYRDRVLVNVFAFLVALPDILKAKRRAGVRKAARLKRVAKTVEHKTDASGR